ncbi:MAG: hypothetical protein EBQ75_06160 [Actinobacteria bacterium]|nr:hypothetical protein [Actinomycetota bacterium]
MITVIRSSRFSESSSLIRLRIGSVRSRNSEMIVSSSTLMSYFAHSLFRRSRSSGVWMTEVR